MMNSKQLEQKISQSSIVIASTEQISSDLGGEAVILNLKSGVYHGLNEVGARVWNLIQEPRTVKDIKQALLEEYDVEAEQCQNDLMALLEDLLVSGLININNAAPA
jgi:Coenzyme PQQ synthesis protein D (PqqD)